MDFYKAISYITISNIQDRKSLNVYTSHSGSKNVESNKSNNRTNSRAEALNDNDTKYYYKYIRTA
jgi:hypothetical protein